MLVCNWNCLDFLENSLILNWSAEIRSNWETYRKWGQIARKLKFYPLNEYKSKWCRALHEHTRMDITRYQSTAYFSVSIFVVFLIERNVSRVFAELVCFVLGPYRYVNDTKSNGKQGRLHTATAKFYVLRDAKRKLSCVTFLS